MLHSCVLPADGKPLKDGESFTTLLSRTLRTNSAPSCASCDAMTRLRPSVVSPMLVARRFDVATTPIIITNEEMSTSPMENPLCVCALHIVQILVNCMPKSPPPRRDRKHRHRHSSTYRSTRP